MLEGWYDKYETNKKRAKDILFKQLNFLRQRPLLANIELTYRCNLRCRMCGVWKRGLATRPSWELSCEEYSKLFQDLKGLGTSQITLSGGEPLLRDDIGRILGGLRGLNIRVNIFTNATLLGKKIALILIENRVNKVIVSVDGYGYTHDLVRGVKGCFDKTISGVKNLIEAKRELKSTLPAIDFHTTISKLNVASLDRLDGLCKELGVNFSFQPVSETDISSVKNSILGKLRVGSPRYLPHQDSLYLTNEDVLILRGKLRNVGSNLYVRIMDSISDKDLIGGRLPVRRCFVTRDVLFVDPRGNVYPCTNLDGYFLGNIQEKSIKQIWNGSKHRLLKKALKRELFPVCRYCCHLAHNLTLGQMVRILIGRKL